MFKRYFQIHYFNMFYIYSILIINYFILFLLYLDFIEQLELIHAKVPIIKFCDTIQDLKVDLNCNNAVGIRNTQLLYCYSKRKFN